MPYLGGQVGDGLFSRVFRCPSVEAGNGEPWLNAEGQNHYKYNTQEAIVFDSLTTDNKRTTSIDHVRNPSDARVLYDVAWPDWQIDRNRFPHADLGGGINIAHLDGHAASLSVSEYGDLSPNFFAEHLNEFITEGWDR